MGSPVALSTCFTKQGEHKIYIRFEGNCINATAGIVLGNLGK